MQPALAHILRYKKPASVIVGPPTVTFVGTVHTGVQYSGNSAFYAGASIGSASNDRFLIVAWSDVQSGVGNAVTSVVLKVTGQSDIAMTFASLADANGTNVIAWASVPSAYGTTGDVWITTGAGFANDPALTTYTTLLSTLSSTTPTDTKSASSGSNTSINNSLTTGVGGFVIAVGINGINTGLSGSFTSFSPDAAFTFGGGRHTISSLNSVAGTSQTVTFTQSGTADTMQFVAAAWR